MTADNTGPLHHAFYLKAKRLELENDLADQFTVADSDDEAGKLISGFHTLRSRPLHCSENTASGDFYQTFHGIDDGVIAVT